MANDFFDVGDINTYADSVWNDSLTGNTRLINASLRAVPGKYDEFDLSTGVVANKQKKDRNFRVYNDLLSRMNVDDSYGSTEDFLYTTEEEDKEKDIDKQKILLQRKKKRENHKKFVGRMAAAIVICCITTGYTVGYTLANNPELLDKFKDDKTASTIVEKNNIDVKTIAEKRLNAIKLLYSNYIKNNPKLIYTNGASYSYDKTGKMVFSYNSDGITKILKTANEKSELDFRVALFIIANEINKNELYNTIVPCVREVGYDFILRKDDDGLRKLIGPGYVSLDEYLQFEPNNIYTDIVYDTEVKINNGSIYVYPNGSFYEIDDTSVNRERSK